MYKGERGIEKPGGINSTGKSSNSTHVNNNIQRTYRAPLNGQDSTNNRLVTPALPCLPLPKLDIPSDAKPGLMPLRWQVLTVAHWEQQDQPQ